MKKYLRLLLFIWVVIFSAVVYFLSFIPSEKEIRSCMTTKMYHIELCPGSSSYVPLKQISPFAQRALIVAEDANFYTHNGFDWDAIQASAEKNLAAGKFLRGGSTLTQQLAKNLFLSEEKTLLRKAIEATITYRLEKTLKKNEIMERYFNVVKFGKNIFGIKNAAEFYFKKKPAELNVAESAFLIMLLPSPERYSRSFYKKELSRFASARVDRIINDLYKSNRISLEQFFNAQADAPKLFRGRSGFQPANSDSTDKDDAASAKDANTPAGDDEDSTEEESE